MRGFAAAGLLAAAVALADLPAQPPPAPAKGSATTSEELAAAPTPTPRPEDKTLVASLEEEQGAGKDRLSVYRDGTLAYVRTYEGVRKVKRKVLSEEEVDFVGRVCSEALALDVGEYHVDVVGRGEPRRLRIEVGRAGELPRVFRFDELAQVPLVLGRARGVLEGLRDRFDENAVSQDALWDPGGLKEGDVLTNRFDGKRYRIARDDTFVRSLELVEAERGLQRLVVLREDVPKLFVDPAGESGPEGKDQ